MKMISLEKRLVNRQKKSERNIKKVCEGLQSIDVNDVHDVLEIGCGTGAVSAYLAAHYNMNVRGIDLDPDQILTARELHPENGRLDFFNEDATRLTWANNSFDLVISQNVFHHIPEWQTVADELVRVVRPRGYLMWFDLTFSRLVKKVLYPFMKDYLGLYTFEEIKSFFKSKDFSIWLHQKEAHGPFMHHHLVLRKS